MDATETIRLRRVRADGALIEFEQRPDYPDGRPGYRAYHFTARYEDPGANRVRFPSVTTLVGKISPKDSLRDWYERMGAAGALRLARLGVLDGVEPEDAIDLVREHQQGASGHSARAQFRGRELHAVLERYARDGDVPNPIDFPPEWRGYVQALARWIIDAELQATGVERLVAHAGLKYAGRYDLRGFVRGLDALADLKSRERPRVYWDDLLQVSGYDLADQDGGAPAATTRLVVSIGADGTYVEEEAPDSLLDVWRHGLTYANFAAPIRSAWESSQRAKAKAAA